MPSSHSTRLKRKLAGKPEAQRKIIIAQEVKRLKATARELSVKHSKAKLAEDYLTGARHKELLQNHRGFNDGELSPKRPLTQGNLEAIIRDQTQKFPGLKEASNKNRKTRTKREKKERYLKLKSPIPEQQRARARERNKEIIKLFNRGMPIQQIIDTLAQYNINKVTVSSVISATRKSNPKAVSSTQKRLNAVKQWRAKAEKEGIYYDSTTLAQIRKRFSGRRFDRERYLLALNEEFSFRDSLKRHKNSKTKWRTITIDTLKFFLNQPGGVTTPYNVRLFLLKKGYGKVHPDAVSQMLSELSENGLLFRLQPGMYSIPKRFEKK